MFSLGIIVLSHLIFVIFIINLLVWRSINDCAPVVFLLRVNLSNAQDKSQVNQRTASPVGYKLLDK